MTTGLLEPRPPPPAAGAVSGRTVATDPPEGLGGCAGRLRPLGRPVAAFLASRILVALVVLVTMAIVGDFHPVTTLGSIFDGRWYLEIAQHGYPHHLVQEGAGNRWAFFPAFPLAVRALAEVTSLSLPASAVVEAFAFGLTSAVAVWLAVREVCGRQLADRAVLLYVFFPSAYVLSLGYTEGLFVTAAALCLWALSRHAFVWAGLFACVAGMTRNAGVVVILAVLVTAAPPWWRDRDRRALLGSAIAPLGFAAFTAYAWVMVGTPVAFLAAERFWPGKHFVGFTTPAVAALAAIVQGPGDPGFVADAAAAAVLVLGFLGVRWLDRMGRVIPSAWWVFTVGALLIAFSPYSPDSMPRYVMAAFPLFAVFAWRLRARGTWIVAGLMGLLQSLFLLDVLSTVRVPVGLLVP